MSAATPFGSDAVQSPLAALRAELNALTAVRDALLTEHAALTESAAATLEVAVGEKNVAIAELADWRGRREMLLGSDKLREAVTERITDVESRGQALDVVADLQRLGRECQQLNQRNGLLISGLRDMTANALGVLRGEPTVKLYGQSGSRDEQLGSRVIGTA